LLAAEDLLRLARPYCEQIEQSRKRFNGAGVIDDLPQGIWQLEKSLSIGSFMAKYAGVEALVNCGHDDFGVREAEDLSVDYFVAPLDKRRTKLLKKAFKNWNLSTRVFFLPSLCIDPVVDPRDVFDVTSLKWRQFVETVTIRHSFSHAASVRQHLEATKTGPKFWLVNDDHPDNYWLTTRTPKDHRTFNYHAALKLNGVIDWVLSKLTTSMPTQLDEKYFREEKWEISDQ